MSSGDPPFLPAQENIKDTYMDPQYIPAGDYTVALINQGSESHVCEAWTIILKDVFSVYDGFVVDHEVDKQDRRVDMEVGRVVNNRMTNFLALVLKQSSYSSSTKALEDAKTKLKGHLQSLGNTREGKLWGALCIGKSVQFYQCSMESGKPELFVLHDGMLQIDRQPQTVKQWLQHIRSNVIR
ncbi:hypothetical protein F52700_5173 [Fusarium sp. NRRL 52700]|nr:hypothetical protein F52700_5173 [Fusarium sp. NRRL 52700]